MNILLTFAFCGTRYHGWQVQQNALAICPVLQDALQKVLGARPDVKGCSRTDAGVHALAYCASFHHETDIADYKLPLALNRCLPPDIRVHKAQRVPEDFHARYDAVGKQYRYVWLNAPADDPFSAGFYYRLSGHMDHEAMHAAAQGLAGRHDFAAFMSAGSDIEDTVRTITHFSVRREHSRVILEVAADGFLYNMVRILAGTLLQVGQGRRTAQDVQAALQSKNRKLAGETQPAKGLFLAKVFYPPHRLAAPAGDF